ncbi:MAG TPA: MFS transporter [Dongiaceae bacterium]
MTTPGAVVFAVMFTLESLARATLTTITVNQAYQLLSEKSSVNLLYSCVYATTLCVSFAIPDLIRRFRRRWVYSLGVLLTIAAALLLSAGNLAGQIGGMLSYAIAGSITSVTLQLYMMDYIQRRDFVLSEPLRLVFSAAAWGAGPFLGVWLNQTYGNGMAEIMSATSAALLLAYFWYLRLTENPAVAAATRPPPRPVANIRRFMQQPRLRLGWFIAFGRSSWWSMFFVVPPLYLTDALGTEKGHFWGGLLVSAGNILLIITPVIGRLATRHGIRRPIVAAFVGLGCTTILASLLLDSPLAVGLCLLGGSVCAVVLDALGNIPFIRAVRPLERPQMATVFRSYADLSSLMPAAVFSLLLLAFNDNIAVVFLASGLFALAVGWVARHLPRTM